MVDLIALSAPGSHTARRLGAHLSDGVLHLHDSIPDRSGARSFSRTVDLVSRLFPVTDGIVFVGPVGVMVRALAPHLQSKLTDPPVVVMDVLGRYAISLVSGHQGGANALALRVANIIGNSQSKSVAGRFITPRGYRL
jgi:cobalt-precorrin 5A hydrolase